MTFHSKQNYIIYALKYQLYILNLFSGRLIKLPDNFTIEMVSEEAKETYQNWFFKIASIRELIPRLYIEAAILSSYRFIKPELVAHVNNSKLIFIHLFSQQTK